MGDGRVREDSDQDCDTRDLTRKEEVGDPCPTTGRQDL